MLRLGIIGTSWISQEFIKAAHLTGRYRLHAVYSRHIETAQTFVILMILFLATRTWWTSWTVI